MNYVVTKIDGKEYGFKFTMITLEKLGKRVELEYHEIFDYLKKEPFGALNNVFVVANMVYNRGEEMNEYEMDDLITKMNEDQIRELRNAFRESLAKMIEKFASLAKEESKKN